jgi:glutathione synthase/RimK-type ligase-like ATP-grasp enzyme
MVFFQKWMVLPQHALAAATYLEHAGTPFISREVLHQNPVSKLGEMMLLIEGGLLYPKTVVGAISNLRHLLMAGGSPFSYPFIIKDISGSRGSRNYLVTDAAMLDDIESQNNSVSFMAQEFIANKSDYRITIVGGEIMYALERTRASDTHLNNTSQGGQGAFIEIAVLPQKMQDTALKAAAATGRLDFAGVDIIANGDEQYWVLEVNKSPEIQTGFGVDYKSQKLIDYFTRRLK